MELQPHQERVIEERNALQEKVNKLDVFLVGTKFNTLSTLEQSHLLMQQSAMRMYLNILNLRINNW